MKVYIRTGGERYPFMVFRETICLYMGVDWEFTKRLKYITRTWSKGETNTELLIEIKDLYTSKIKNPNYCKYYGDRRKFIDVYAKHWIYSNKFGFDLSEPETEEIYECA